MERFITFTFGMFVAIASNAQKVVSHTTLLSKVYDDRIEQTDFTDGHTTFTLLLSITENKVGKSVRLVYTDKDKLASVLQYLYDFKQGEGYDIDLESTNGGRALSFGRGFYVYTPTDIDKIPVSRYALGKLLDGLCASVKTTAEPPAKGGDDMYSSSQDRF